MDVVLNAVTPWRGWVIADDLTARSLTGGDWWRVSAAEAVELARVIERLPRPVRPCGSHGCLIRQTCCGRRLFGGYDRYCSLSTVAVDSREIANQFAGQCFRQSLRLYENRGLQIRWSRVGVPPAPP